MDPEFPYLLPGEARLLVLAYSADRGGILKVFSEACKTGRKFLAQRWADLFGLAAEDTRNSDNCVLALACENGHLGTARWPSTSA